MRVCIYGQPAIDAGGVCKQFFAVVFGELACTAAKLLSVFNASILSSGVLSAVGTMIAHSLLLDGQGFPYLSKYCYNYIAGHCNQAVACVTIDDTGENVKLLLKR